jgi:hypothetical protein
MVITFAYDIGLEKKFMKKYLREKLHPIFGFLKISSFFVFFRIYLRFLILFEIFDFFEIFDVHTHSHTHTHLIRLQRIYNFLCSMLVFTPFT